MIAARRPFEFSTAGYLIRITNQRACSIAELAAGVAECTDASIFHHTFQTLGQHHFLTEGFSNDFAQWALASANRIDLAEQLASLDIRDYVGLAEVRSDLNRILKDYSESHPGPSRQTALEPFYFLESVEIATSLGEEAASLEEFRQHLKGITQISRFDRLKDPVGVVCAYRIVKRYFDCQLVLAGGGASDDPEGPIVLEEVREAAGNDPDIHILELPPVGPARGQRAAAGLGRCRAQEPPRGIRADRQRSGRNGPWWRRPWAASRCR